MPAGTPLVVAAAHAGVEIPVFCYEPRLGPPVGACRMCLVEVEMGGRPMPKLQAACTMTAADGMIVRSAATSEKAEEGQDAVLEFLLLNHPLDCPVCDKGGECPLQDLAFRYGPGKSRMTLPKRTYEKPLPISPSIVLDRERCILCYRCTRFSSDVAEDGELIARERGARSVIATFEERPYVGAFSGNVTELCPVGALLPTPYRFKARPWEIVNVPTVCQGCATGCNTWTTVREGRAERILSRNHPEIDDGWLCDRGRFARHEPLADRLREPLQRSDAGLAEVTVGRKPRARSRSACGTPTPCTAHGSVAIATGGNLTNEEAYVWGRIARELRARTASGPVAAEGAWELLDPYAARIDDLDRADVIVVVGDADVADRAGTLDLRIRKARRRGAHLMIVGPGGSALERDAGSLRPSPAGATAQALAGLVADPGPLAGAAHPVLIVTDPVDVARDRGRGPRPRPARARRRAAAARRRQRARRTPLRPRRRRRRAARGDRGRRGARAGAARRRSHRRVARGRPLADGACAGGAGGRGGAVREHDGVLGALRAAAGGRLRARGHDDEPRGPDPAAAAGHEAAERRARPGRVRRHRRAPRHRDRARRLPRLRPDGGRPRHPAARGAS